MPSDSAIEQRREEVRNWYVDARHRYRRVEDLVGERVRRALREAYLHDVKFESRTKTHESMADKAVKVVDGMFKYANPRTDITDFVGFRLLAPLVTDLPPVQRLLAEMFVVEESSDRRPHDEVDVPGYQSVHLLVRLRPGDRDDVDLRDLGDPVIEIQVRTILQHAWAALQHDLLYKSEREPSDAVKRRLVALAGLLELAEREFVQVRQVHGIEPDTQAPGITASNTAAWRDAALRSLFGDDDVADHDWDGVLSSVLEELGLTSGGALVEALGETGPQARTFARAVRSREPWAPREYIADLLLRQQLGARYLELRAGGRVLDPAVLNAFRAERDEVATLIGRAST